MTNAEKFAEVFGVDLPIRVYCTATLEPSCKDCVELTNCEAWLNEEYKETKDVAIKPLDQEPRWIPVSERLPDTDDKVLCWYEYYHWSREKVLPEYGLGRYFKESKAWCGEVANGRDVRVIAWMPLPKAYREVEE